jgi:DNA invertase Pin-like site-specific DNA recombinase
MKDFYANCAMYLRKSRAEENEDTQTVLEKHKTHLVKFAKAHTISIKRVYEEVVSGDSLFARPLMVELLKDIEDKKYSGVLCMDIDRLGRGNMQEQGFILNTFKDTNTAIITPDKTYDLNNEIDETQTELKTFMARQELKMIKKRLQRGIRATIEKGGYIANAPFGYLKVYKDKVPTLEPHPQESEIVKLIFDLYIQGEGCQSICYTLSNMGVKPHRGEQFCRTSIRKILTNSVYIGKIVWNRKKCLRPKSKGELHKVEYLPESEWLVVDGIHPAIISEDIFITANAILTGKYHVPYRQSNQIENPLAGILMCSVCGHAMSRRAFADRKYQTAHILCITAGCNKSSRLDYVEEKVIYELKELYDNLINEEHSKPQEVNKKVQIDAMKTELKKIAKQEEKLYDLLEQGLYTVELFKERESRLRGRTSELNKALELIEEEEKTQHERTNRLIPQIKYVLQNYWVCNAAEKNKLLKSVIEKAYYYKDKSAKPKDFIIETELRKNCI